MDMGFVFILFVLPFLILLFFLIGIIKLYSDNEATRLAGRSIVLYTFIALIVGVLIGFSICTGM